MKIFGLIFSALFLSTLTFAQCDKLENHPQGKDYAMKLFVYRDFIQAKQYEQAIPKWEELYKYCKAGNGNILNDGETIYEYLASKATDEAKKKEYNEKVAEIMQHRVECYGKKKRSNGLAYAGYRNYQLGKHYFTELKDYEKAKAAFDESLRLDGNKVEKGLVIYYPFIAVQLYQEEKLTVEEMRTIHAMLTKMIAENTDFADAQAGLDSEYTKIERDIFDCKYFVERISPDFYSHYNDAEYIKETVIRDLKKADCGEEHPLAVKAIARYKAVVDSIKVGEWNDIDWAKDFERNDNMSEAKSRYAKGIADGSIDQNKRYEAAMRLAKLNQRDGEWSSALANFRTASDLNSSTGEPYLSIGLLYLAANKGCGGFERQLVAGAAIDQFAKARNYSDTAGEAAEKISTYSAYLPTREVIFQNPNYSIGSSVTVGCVLRATTTVKTSD